MHKITLKLFFIGGGGLGTKSGKHDSIRRPKHKHLELMTTVV
jgi:hypothetical protein